MIRKEAKWVAAEPTCEAPIFCGELNWSSEFEKAEISICGLGFFELYINGKKVSDDLLVPAWSDYEPRRNKRLLYPLQDTFTHRIYYLDYNITAFLKEGKNALEIWLGNGWYNQHERNVEGDLRYGSPKLIYSIALQKKDGTGSWVDSDETLTWQDSPIYFNNVYYGEKWDFSRLNDRFLQPVRVLPRQESEFCRQACPADKEVMACTPIPVKRDGARRIYDAGVNMTGYVRCRGIGHVMIRYAEELDGEKELDFSSAGGIAQIQCDEYVTEKWRVLQPKFSLKAFRYIEVIGEAEDVEAVTVHSDIAVTSGFSSDNEVLNWIYETYVRTQLNNSHYGVVSDCPHRERLGYTGDGQLTCRAGMMLLGSRELYRKWIQDIMDCQDVNSGHVQHTAPFYGGGGGPGGWGGAVVIVPWQFYMQYGELSVLAKCWPHMQKWFYYMKNHCENDLVMTEEEGGWCLGDWCTPKKVQIPEPLVNTYYFIKAMEYMLRIIESLREHDQADAIDETVPDEIRNQLTASRRAMKDAYYRKPEGMLQGAEAFLADIGIADEEDLLKLNEKYAKAGAYDTGIFGTYVLTGVLLEHGFADTAYKLLTSEKENASFGYMKKCGATAFWENWNGAESHDHPMFGAIAEYLFSGFLGIRAAAPGYSKVIIEPRIPSGVSRMEGEILTPAGKIRVSFDRNREKMFTAEVGAKE
ncbi:MAG: family 78 glycoside hydrolase catalytic domain [Lachnospiraceae bacterium]|nr:family 78 glycoside hydrolase catalytic domain [Lachnospiraceae bacterium]